MRCDTASQVTQTGLMRCDIASQVTQTGLLHLNKFKIYEPRSFEDEIDTFLRNVEKVTSERIREIQSVEGEWCGVCMALNGGSYITGWGILFPRQDTLLE
jgi:hypothetical protein